MSSSPLQPPEFKGKPASQLTELECSIDLLSHPNIPKLNLEKLKLQYVHQPNPVPLRFIFRHRIKTLDLSDFDRLTLRRNRLDEKSAGQKSVEHLILSSRDLKLSEYVLPFLENFIEHLPALKIVDLTVDATQALDGESIAEHLLAVYEEILKLKERFEGSLSQLNVRFYGDGFVLEGRDFVPDWIKTLKENEQFKQLEAEYEPNKETIHFNQYEGILSLDFEASLTILSEEEYQQVIDDNIGGYEEYEEYPDDDPDEDDYGDEDDY